MGKVFSQQIIAWRALEWLVQLVQLVRLTKSIFVLLWDKHSQFFSSSRKCVLKDSLCLDVRKATLRLANSNRNRKDFHYELLRITLWAQRRALSALTLIWKITIYTCREQKSAFSCRGFRLYMGVEVVIGQLKHGVFILKYKKIQSLNDWFLINNIGRTSHFLAESRLWS